MSADGATRPGPWPDECQEDPASCDCAWHENARAAAESHRDRQLPLPNVPAPSVVASSPRAFRRERQAARFKVLGPFDGAPSATVTIAGGLFIVRPFGRRRVYELRLADVARGVLYDVVKAELERAARARRNARAAKRGKGRP